MPGLATVHAHLHLRNDPGATPGPSTDDMRTALERRLIVAWKRHNGTHPDGGNQLFVGIVRRVAIVIKLPMVPAVGWFAVTSIRCTHFYRPVPGPSRYEQAHWRTVQVFEQLAVLRPGEHRIGMQGFFQR